ncbi:putative tRNA pseudouridine synthase D [Methanocella conradii HZ254]|uniref:Probable tRNA pseudouridine synthase D n=1 Tax=Methanocella conradii (strain DSM 24694 / JCM 17849 / CGMCC 1.5162 / HZ254) TaxID=1041930 RepID=H8I607_METCZ|nr:tRNA pseudouridine(13) synthase TruD [Methanocella conradii]AFD00241.1 putative tRNA pseudouridine synthase D [Methanocella conradii HZ254]MDI6895947.1 tRNA pseudouridine(13) synthase TruD [Methanocella conradii]
MPGLQDLRRQVSMARKTPFELEMLMGIEAYMTDEEGIGGDLRIEPADFKVSEISDFKVGQSGEYLIVRLTKENWETHHLIRDLSRQLGISEERIGIAGTKDKRAVTSQLISIRGISEEQLARVDLPRVRLEPIGRANRDIGLGDLRGNEFDINIKNIVLDKEGLSMRVKAIDESIARAGGVPNFFGYQRFGIVRPVTHLVGKKLVQGDVEGAAMAYIAASFPGEMEENRKARDLVFKTKDFKEGLKLYPLNLRYERAMMHYLVEHPGDYAGAFRALSPRLLKLFVHAYQSYLFNRLLSRRMLDGISLVEPVEGDVICFADGRGVADVSKLEVVTGRNLADVRFLIKRHRAFVTLPLIGKDTALDGGITGEEERRILEEEGITPADFAIAAMPDLASSGSRREAMLGVKPNIAVYDGVANVKFFLPKGSYATTVLREYMKSSPEHMD